MGASSSNLSSSSLEKLDLSSIEEMRVNKIIMVFGTTGCGKSTIVNMLFNDDFTKNACEQPRPIGNTAAAVTTENAGLFNHKDGNLYLDTVGLGDAQKSDLEVILGIKNFLGLTNFGVHCIIIVAEFGRLTREERNNLKAISTVFDKRWMENSILVLTNYNGDPDPASKGKAFDEWVDGDREIQTFVDMIGGRYILTDNSIAYGIYEEQSRPLRQQCLEELKQFIGQHSSSVVGPAPTSFVDKLRHLLELMFSGYRSKRSLQRIENTVRRICDDDRRITSDECSICFGDITMKTMARTECYHKFHEECLKKALTAGHNACPICRRIVSKIILATFHKTNDDVCSAGEGKRASAGNV